MPLVMLILALLSAHVSLDCAHRLRTHAPRQALVWLTLGALGLGSGVWSMHIVGMDAQDLNFPLWYRPLPLILSWLSGTLLSMLGLLLAHSHRSIIVQLFGGSALLGCALTVPHILALMAIGFEPGIEWGWGNLFIAVLVATLGSAFAFVAAGLWGDRQRRIPWLHASLAALLLALGMIFSPWQVFQAAHLSVQTGSAYAELLSLQSLKLLAAFASPILLAMTLALSMIESRMRATLDKAESSLEHQNQIDQLTGLPNRQFFEEQLARAVYQSDQTREQLALLFIDLDGFKPVNETFGHRFGDVLLTEVVQRFNRVIGAGDLMARMGGDEFLVLLRQNPDKEEVAARARQLLEHLSQPLVVQDREIPMTASIGIALYPSHGALTTLVAHADAAAHAAKSAGGSTYCFFEPHMIQDTREQTELLRDLRNALNNRELELYYQPKIHAPSGEITGAEALLRWNHPSRGLISPAVFIPIAERFGLINAIGSWVIDEACRQIRAWRDGGLRMRVAVNLSVHQLRQNNLLDRIQSALQKYEVNPTLLTCEITESMAMEDTESIQTFFQKLGQIGVHISIDDFGTGYSSLAQLRQLPTEELKIDKSFVRDLETSSDARTVVDAVVKLGLALGLKVVAEGVESNEQFQLLRELGCNELQGFYFAKPMAANSLYIWAKSDSGPNSLAFRTSLFGDTQPPPLDELPSPS